MSASPSGSQSLRLSFVLRWLGITLVALLALQMAVLLSAADWADGVFKQLLIERLVNQAPMGLIGLLLMLLGSRLDQPETARPPIRWLVCVLAILMIVVVPVSISGNQNLSGESDQTLEQQKGQLEMARQQSANPENVKMLGNQLTQAGQLPADASEDDKVKAAQAFIDKQLAQMEQQIKQGERQRNLAVNQRRFGGTLSAVILAVAFVLLALAAVI
ncbi:HpsJ family protein [Synechococcus sp. AH-224-I15]|nr:HpsJ family protein [Synechococcus sp. AH-224-I15]